MIKETRLMLMRIASGPAKATFKPLASGFIFQLALCSFAGTAQGSPTPQLVPTLHVPPPALPAAMPPGGPTEAATTPMLYSIGQPTDEEQLYLELINRSRADPAGEGQRLASTTDPDVVSAYASFAVDLTLMQSEFSSIPAAAPLAMNGQLVAAARWHSGDMYTNQYQGHYQTNGSTIMNPGARITADGYTWRTYGENVYAYAKSVFYGQAGFDVDWGVAVGGMQIPPEHRINLHDPRFREAGIGVVDGVGGLVGPQLVTQDFAVSLNATPLVSGVAYYDLNGNGFYDVGEGVGGIQVAVEGSSSYAVTANSGGYTVPVTTNGSYWITFSAAGLPSIQQFVTVSNLNNVKVDFVPIYLPPVISGPNPAIVGQSNLYAFTPVGAATGYQWQQTQLAPYVAVEGAENGLANVTVSNSLGYNVLSGDLVASGSYSFHLAQPEPRSQYLTLDTPLLLGTNSQLTFAKLLGWATTNQVARAQVSTNSGADWLDVWLQAGDGGSGDPAFTTVSVGLNAYAGQVAQFRFVYDWTSGSFSKRTDAGFGLYLDDIAVSDAEQFVNQSISPVEEGTSFSFDPPQAADYLLQVNAQLPSRTLGWGPALRVTAIGQVPPPILQVVGGPIISSGQLQLDFTVANYRTGMSFRLWKALDPMGVWTQDDQAILQNPGLGSRFGFRTSTQESDRSFYRVQALY